MYELHYEVLWRYLPDLQEGIFLAVTISLASIVFGTALGLVVALARTSKSRILRLLASAYIQILRNIPLLLILVIIYFVLPLIGIRGINRIQSAILAMSIYAAAYLAEVFRAGLEAVQTRYVMIGEVLPAIGNNVISLFKDSSLASAISVPEITFVGRQINTDTFRVIEAWTAVATVYLVIVFLASFILQRLERAVVRWR
jgi:polar amino acid transport system permease protein